MVGAIGMMPRIAAEAVSRIGRNRCAAAARRSWFFSSQTARDNRHFRASTAAESFKDLGQTLSAQLVRVPVDGPSFTAHSISSIASTPEEPSGPTSSRQFSTGATQK